MKLKLQSLTSACAVLAAASLMSATRVHATIVVADGFFPSNDNYSPINGYAPTTPGLDAGATWTSSVQFFFSNTTASNYFGTANSAGVVGGPGGGGVSLDGYNTPTDGATLPIPTLQSGYIYTLSADFVPAGSGSTGWGDIGFYSKATGGSPIGNLNTSGNLGGIWYSNLGSAQAGPTIGDPGNGTGGSLPAGSLSAVQHLTFAINTAAPTWTYSATIGSHTLISNEAYASNPTGIDSILIGLNTNGDGYPGYKEGVIANLSLTQSSVPEPATCASLLAGLGMLTALRFRRN